MAEQEVIKHTKKVYKIWNSKEYSLWHKLKEFVIEILIIVFAVSLSIWLHDWSEKKHKEEDVHVFLNGLRGDLITKITLWETQRNFYKVQGNEIDYLRSVSEGSRILKDSLSLTNFFQTASEEEPNGRYEGFLSSGKIGNIENDLQNDVLNLYQQQIPSLNKTINLFERRKEEIIRYIQQNSKVPLNDKANLVKIMAETNVQNMLSSVTFSKVIADRYQFLIDNNKKIIGKIDKLLKK